MNRYIALALAIVVAVIALLCTKFTVIYPQHLVDIIWLVDNYDVVDSARIDVEIESDMPETNNVYIAPLSGNLIYSEPFYLGVITRIPAVYKSSIDAMLLNNRFISKGKGSVFSRWNTLDLRNIKMPENGFYFAADYEGEHYISARTLFRWNKGKYTFRIERAKFGVEDKNNASWYNAYIYEHSTGNIHYCGSIKYSKDEKNTATKRYNANRSFYSFVECFETEDKKDAFEHFSVRFGQLYLNEKPCSFKDVLVRYNEHTYEYAYAEKRGETIVVDVDPKRKGINTEQRKGPLPESNRITRLSSEEKREAK